jgi:ribosomal protein L37AE/L43A
MFLFLSTERAEMMISRVAAIVGYGRKQYDCIQKNQLLQRNEVEKVDWRCRECGWLPEDCHA